MSQASHEADPLGREAGAQAWTMVSNAAQSFGRTFPTRGARLALARIMAANFLSKPDLIDLIPLSAVDDLRWVVAGGDPLDPADGFLGGRPSERSKQPTTVAALIAGLSTSVPRGGRP